MTEIDVSLLRTAAVRRPRLALMGEFSAGKSTLANLLLGRDASPVKVTATQLPPIWYSLGSGEPSREDLEGVVHPVDLDRLDEVSAETTRVIRVPLEADLLEACDLIDMPGISDPNMSADVWQRSLHLADGFIWCTHATQAWRQSEAAVWDTMPDEMYDRSLLLLTRMDKILTERDRARIVHRIRKETDGLFRGVFPISLLRAAEAGDDEDRWIDSGADAFMEALLDLLGAVSPEAVPSRGATAVRRPTQADDPVSGGHGIAVDDPEEDIGATPPPAPEGAVLPRRISPSRPDPVTPRPERSATP